MWIRSDFGEVAGGLRCDFGEIADGRFAAGLRDRRGAEAVIV